MLLAAVWGERSKIRVTQKSNRRSGSANSHAGIIELLGDKIELRT